MAPTAEIKISEFSESDLGYQGKIEKATPLKDGGPYLLIGGEGAIILKYFIRENGRVALLHPKCLQVDREKLQQKQVRAIVIAGRWVLFPYRNETEQKIFPPPRRVNLSEKERIILAVREPHPERLGEFQETLSIVAWSSFPYEAKATLTFRHDPFAGLRP